MFKSTFGQPTSTTGFGSFSTAANANPFGQSSVFGKTPTTAFGTTQAPFGATTNTGLFGNTLQSTGGLFGTSNTTPTFGQAQTTQSFGFGTNTQPTTTLFGNQPTGTGLFGSSTPAFGQNKTAFGSTFGATTGGLFGAQQPAQQAAPLFGQSPSTSSTGLFGATTSAFGTATQQTGTVIKFNPITGSDTMVKAGVTQTINTRHFCITCMKEYENKSLEELRYEDYLANRKGPQPGLFGSPSQPTSLFGTNTNPTGMFGQPAENKTLFGGLNTSFGSTPNTMFGANNQSKSLFGNKPATGFGTPAATTTTTGFNFGAQPATNLFGAAENKPFGAAAPQPSLFGQPTTQASTGFGTMNPGFSGFGAQQSGMHSIGLFSGNKPAPSFGTSSTGFTFGSNTATNTGNLFNKPATTGFGAATTGFGTNTFGTNTFGAAGTQNTSLFKPPASTGFSFGSTPATSTGFGNSTSFAPMSFGNTAAKPGGLFGTTNTSTGGLFGSSFGGGTSTFGSGAGNTSFGLGGTNFGTGSSFLGGSSIGQSQPTTTTPHPAILALTAVPFSDSPLFKNLLPASGKTDALLKPNNALFQKAMLNSQDMKVSSQTDTKVKLKPLYSTLSKKSIFEGLDESDSITSIVSNTSNPKKLNLKPKTGRNSSNSGVGADGDNTWVGNLSDKENYLDEGETQRRVGFTLPNEGNTGGESFYIRRNPLFKPPRHSSTMDTIDLGAVADTPLHTSAEVLSQSTTAENQTVDNDTTVDVTKDVSSFDETRADLDGSSRYDEDWQPHQSGIVFRRVDYYTIPSLDELTQLVAEDGTCYVDSFCVGRYGYGNIYYQGTMDVANLNIDEIVHFRHKEVTLYPDDDKKPPVGTELNRKCQVTLEQVWPIDKTTREPIKDPEVLTRLGYEDKLRRTTAKMLAHFIEYRPSTGSWVFRVDHFSKYGLSDSDEEDDVGKTATKLIPPVRTLTQPLPTVTQPASLLFTTNKQQQQQPQLVTTNKYTDQSSNTSNVDKSSRVTDGDVDEDMGDEEEEEETSIDGDEISKDILSPSHHLAKRTGVDTHRVQLMKASLFDHDHMDIENDMKDLDDDYQSMEEDMGEEKLEEDLHIRLPLRNLTGTRSRGTNQDLFPAGEEQHTASRQQLATQDLEDVQDDDLLGAGYAASLLPPPRPNTCNLTHAHSVIPYHKSSVSRISKRCYVDLGLFMSRKFHVGWGPKSVFTSLSTLRQVMSASEFLNGRQPSDDSPSVLRTNNLFSHQADFTHFRESIERHLSIHLDNCLKGEEDGCPVISPLPGSDALHAHCVASVELDTDYPNDEFLSFCKQVWQLCVALWGTLPTLSVEDDQTSHKAIMARKEALTEWLKKSTGQQISEEMDKLKSDKQGEDCYVGAIMALLSGQDVEQACSLSQSKGDHFASLMLTSGPASKLLVQDQLSEWQNVNADAYIDPERLKLLTLASGLPLFDSSHGLVNVCDGLDWKRAFALHFWYLTSPVASIADALKKYDTAFESNEAYACQPHPPYCEDVETTSGRHIYDVCYYLLKLYCNKSFPLERLLNPAACTDDPLDYRLSWLLEQVITSLGYSHHSINSSSVVCVSFATQLESHGLWHWALFIYLHLSDSARRRLAVEEMLGRHVTLTRQRDLTKEEEFVVDQLNIPIEWLYKAKAVLALSLANYHDVAYYMIQAREWNQAHDIIVAKLAPDAIINENYEYLKELLQPLVPNANSISEWNSLGQVLWDYLEVNRVVEVALRQQNTYELESRRSQITSICTRIPCWPCKTAQDRLCQAEIAKRIAHIYHTVVKRQDRHNYREIVETISRLPLPQDYLDEELRHVKEAFQQT